MSFRTLHLAAFSLVVLLVSAASFAQSGPTVAPVAVAPIPYDPLELATGPTVVPDTPEKRALLLGLLERVRQNNAMHTPGTSPFTLKVSFNSSGNGSKNTGYGEVEETWLNGQTWRWSARLGDWNHRGDSSARAAPIAFAK